MQRFAERRAVHVHDGSRSQFEPDRIDHQRVAFVMTDGIAVPGGRDLRGMLLVQAHAADLVILHVKENDLILLLQHLHFLNPEDVRRHHRQAIERRVWIVFAAAQHLAALLHHGRGFGLQDGIVVIAAGIGVAAKAAYRTRAGRRLLKSEGQARPGPCHIGDRRRASRSRDGAGRNRGSDKQGGQTDDGNFRKFSRHVRPLVRLQTYYSTDIARIPIPAGAGVKNPVCPPVGSARRLA